MHGRLALLEQPADSGNSPSRADPRDKNVHRSVGVIPDFRARGPHVELRVGGIRELVEHDGVVSRGHDVACFGHRVSHENPCGQHHFSAEKSEQGHALG